MTTKQTAVKQGAKVPADHAAKAEALHEAVTVNVQGFEFTFEPDSLNDDAVMTALESGNPNPFLEKFAPGQVQNIKKQLRGNDSVLKRSTVLEFVVEVMQAAGEGNV